MKLTPSEDKIVKEFCEVITDRFGDKIISIQLFGSRARGDATMESDVDLLILTHSDDWHLSDAIGDMAYDYLLDTGLYISCKVISQDRFGWMKRIRSSFARFVSEEAIPYAQ